MNPNPCEGCRAERDPHCAPWPHTCPEHQAVEAAKHEHRVERALKRAERRDSAARRDTFVPYVADLFGETY